MTALADRDYFADYEILKEPYVFFEAVREKGLVYAPEGRDYLIVTGFNEILEIMRNTEDYSAVIGLQGCAAPLPFQPRGSVITDQIEAHRAQFHGGDLLANPATKAVLDKHFPGMSEDTQIAMASGMTLRAVQAFAPAQFTDETLDALDAEFAALPVA